MNPLGFDQTQIDELRSAGGNELLVALCTSFLTSSAQRMETLRKETDPLAFSKVCHAFKTNSRIVGARAFGDALEQAEHTCEDGNPISPETIPELDQLYETVRQWVQALLEKAESALKS